MLNDLLCCGFGKSNPYGNTAMWLWRFEATGADTCQRQGTGYALFSSAIHLEIIIQ